MSTPEESMLRDQLRDAREGRERAEVALRAITLVAKEYLVGKETEHTLRSALRTIKAVADDVTEIPF